MMFSHSIRFVPKTLIKYLVFVKNEWILSGLVENSSFYNKVHTEPVEVLEGN